MQYEGPQPVFKRALLTYMSIRDEIERLKHDATLVPLQPRTPGAVCRRALLMSQEVREIFTGPWQALEEEERWGRLEADLAFFVEGGLVVVPDYMKRLSPCRDEVWEIVSRRPKPSVRVFGRFAEPDAFVALTYALRKPLGGFGNRPWRDVMVACRNKWRHLFLSYPPFSGKYPDEYVTENVRLRLP